MWDRNNDDDEADSIRSAIRATEREIFAEATDGDPDSVDGTAAMVDELSQPEGWDGDTLGPDEIAHRNLYGDTDTNFDRPLQLQADAELLDENARLRERVALQDQAIENYVMAPITQQQRAQQRDLIRGQLSSRYDLHNFSDEHLDRFIDDVQQDMGHTQALQEARINASMNHAARKYGRDFDDAYNDLITMAPNSPLAREIVNSVVRGADPGETLMQWHGSHVVKGLAPPPFAGSRRPDMAGHVRQRAARHGGDEMDGAGWGDRDIEDAIFDSVWR
jgi:hypothetical protein